MIALVASRIEAIQGACRRHCVARLEIFGSAASGDKFDDHSSDIDFLVAFPPNADLGPWLAEYFNLRDELEQALDKPVDLVMEGAVHSPLFQRQVDQSRELIYAG